MQDIIDLTVEYPTPLSQGSPSSPAHSGISEGEGSTSQSSLKWYKKVNKYMGIGGHPYVCQAIAVQGSKEKAIKYEDVKFWPFVGPLKPWRTPKGVDWSWKEYEGTIGVCAQGKIIVARCTDDNPWKVLWEMDIDDHLYTIAWTYHPFTCHPLLAVAGLKGLIHIIDTVTKKRIRVLRGHGGDILWLTFNTTHPHILASTSYDKTTRIWNILGSDDPILPEGMNRNENFPMGDADEGNCLFAILVGEGKGGHRAFVSCAVFHPTKNAIATVGLDRHVKIWALPEFPKPSIKPIPTPVGYRANIIYLPIFSTTRLHADFVDNVEWLDEHILVTRSRQEIVIWQWLGFSRFFGPDDPRPRSMDAASSDYNDSGSFLPMSTYEFGSDFWAMNIALHRQFRPTVEEGDSIEDDNLITDPLIGLVAHRQADDKPAPEILLFNPLLAEDDDIPPKPTKEKRMKYKETSTSSEEDEEDNDDDNYLIDDGPDTTSSCKPLPNLDDEKMGEERLEDNPTLNGEDTSLKQVNEDKSNENFNDNDHENFSNYSLTSYEDEDEDDYDYETEKYKDYKINQSLEPWRLISTDFQALIKQLKPKGWKIQENESICNVTISPRGAKWIVGVGGPNTVVVWKVSS